MGLDFVLGRRQLCRLGASAIVAAGLVGCAVEEPTSEQDSHEEVSEKASPQVSQESRVRATEEYVRIIGRTCQDADVTWLPQSGSAIEFAVTGTYLAIELVGDDSVHNEWDLRSRYAVLLDGEVIVDDTLSESTRTVEVFSEELTKNGVVEVIHLSEASIGAVGVGEIIVESDEPDPVRPTPKKGLSIEFIGDSITCAYGVESSGPEDSFTTTEENFMKSYAYLASQELGADYSAVCYSGYGIVSGWTADGTRRTDKLCPPLYDVVAKGYEQPWDFVVHTYDVVVINLGTNDFSYTGTDPDRMSEFAQEYSDFLSWVHELNPDAHLVCTIGTMGAQELFPYIEQVVEEFKGNTGFARITCYATEPLDPETDGCGANFHPNANTQQRDGETLAGAIREVLDLGERGI